MSCGIKSTSKLCWCDWELFLAWEKGSAQVKESLVAHQYKLMMYFTLKIHAHRTRIIYVFPIYESLPSSGCTHWKGGETMRNPSVMSPDCGLQYHFSLKGKKSWCQVWGRICTGRAWITLSYETARKRSKTTSVLKGLSSQAEEKAIRASVRVITTPTETHQICLNPWVSSP